jgi:hypothetical protein
MFFVVDDDDDAVIAFNCWWGDLFFIEPRPFEKIQVVCTGNHS